MNPLDFGALLLLLLAVLFGWRSGALPQIVGLLGAAIGALGGLAATPLILPYLVDMPATVRTGAVILVLLGAVGVGEMIGTAIGQRGSRLLGTGLLGATDRVAGAIVGAGQAVLIVWLAGGILATGAIPSLGQLAQNSKAIRAVGALLPPPTAIVLELGKALDASGLPDVFLGLERLPAQPVDLPADPIAEAIGRAAEASVPRIQADACAIRSTGTGFFVAAGYVVTNAHVVAGSRSISVQTSFDSRPATAVLFDPKLDLAVLRVEGITAPGLILAGHEPSRGDIGATFGYPGGGGAVVEPAAVTDAYNAEGLDISGTQRVTRRIIELRATVEPGDSGGPLILVDGTVGGVVFAESRSDPDVGYALSPTAVGVAIGPAVGRTRAVDTGPCLR